MIRVVLFTIIAVITLITLSHYLTMQEETIHEYNQRVMTIGYYKELFDNIVNSGLFDDLYTYNGYIINGTLYTLNSQNIFPLYILTYYDENSYEYLVALNYIYSYNLIQQSGSSYLDYGDSTVASINPDYLNYFKQKMDEFHTATGVNMKIYYDIYNVYDNNCKSIYSYSFETIYIDKYQFMHIIKVTFC